MKHHSTSIFGKKNYLIMGIGLAVIAIGFYIDERWWKRQPRRI